MDNEKEISPVGKRLKEAFDYAPNSEIANSLKIANSAVTAYMNGRIPPIEKLIEINKITGYSIDWIVTGEGEKKTNLTGVRRKKFSEDDTKPITLLFHSGKGGIGTTTAAVMISSVLADKGKKILLVDDGSGAVSFIMSPDKTAKSFGGFFYTVGENSYYSTDSENLDVSVPAGTWLHSQVIQKRLNRFDKKSDVAKKKYDYIIIDSLSNKNPFNNALKPLSYFTSPTKVIVPYQPSTAPWLGAKRVLKYIEFGQSDNQQIDLLALFINNCSNRPVTSYNGTERKRAETFGLLESNFFATKIGFDDAASELFASNPKSLLSKNTRIVIDYKNLAEEVEEKLEVAGKIIDI
jgi:chromosome partitioning protein